MAEAVAEEYRSSLSDLNCNSKPHINMLTMLAEDNVKYAEVIVETIVTHIKSVRPDLKLPAMYLVDSIIKNIGGLYIHLFCKHMIILFSSVFEKVEENTRSLLFKLRQTWNDILPNNILYGIDCRVRSLDPAWPLSAKAPTKSSIHLNPKFLGVAHTQQRVLLEAEAEMKKKLSLLKEKKKELSKTLAMKKQLEVTARQKKTVAVLPQDSEKSVSYRDPRLKKNIVTSQEVATLAANKLNSNSSTLQSVVVVPNTKISSHDLMNLDGSLNDSQSIISKVKPVQNVINLENGKGSHLSSTDKNGRTTVTAPSANVQDISINKHLKNETNKDISRDNETLNKDHPSKRFKNNYNNDINRKRHTSPENELTSQCSAPKIICKQPSPYPLSKKSVNDLMGTESDTLRTFNSHMQNSLQKENNADIKSNIKQSAVDKDFHPVESLTVPHPLKNESDPEGKKSYCLNSSMLQPSLFGNKDKDYRQLLGNDRDHKLNQLHNHAGHPSNYKVVAKGDFSSSQDLDAKNQSFKYRDHKKLYSYVNSVMDNPYTIMHQAEEKYRSGRISKYEYDELCRDMHQMMDSDEFHQFKHLDVKDKSLIAEARNSPNFLKSSNEEERRNFEALSGHRGKDAVPVPLMKSLVIDNKVRTIYFVGSRILTFSDDNEPRELSFQGPPRNVFVEGHLHPLNLGFDGRAVEFETEGKWNLVRFGTPFREIYINNHPYEAQFGGPPITVVLADNKVHRIRIDGPPPQVVMSSAPAYDLYKIFKSLLPQPPMHDQSTERRHFESAVPIQVQDVDMRLKDNTLQYPSTSKEPTPESMKDVDWRQMPPQEFHRNSWNVPKNSFETPKSSAVEENVGIIKSKPYSESLVVQGAPEWKSQIAQPSELSHPVGRLGMPPPCASLQTERFSEGVNETSRQFGDGNLTQKNTEPPWKQPNYRGTEPSSVASAFNQCAQATVATKQWQPLPPPPMFPGPLLRPPPPHSELLKPPPAPHSELLKPPPPPPLTELLKPPPLTTELLQPPPLPPVLSAPIKTVAGPSAAVSTTNTSSSVPHNLNTSSKPPSSNTLGSVNVESFLQKLVAAGIIGPKSKEPSSTTVSKDTKDIEKQSEDKNDVLLEAEPVPEIEFTSKSLRKFHPGIITALYKGTQCATCGMRFKEIQSEQYSRHLDWHFRMNRREKDGAKKPFSRRLFYEVKDWIQFKEFEDLEERTPSYFELQADGGQSKAEEHETIYSVRAGECETEKCSVCGEQFQLFWVEEEEEWHLRHAVRHNEQAYHPACYEDFKKASECVETTVTNVEEAPSSPKEEAEEESDKAQLPSVSGELDITCIKQEITDDTEKMETDKIVESSELSDESSLIKVETDNNQNDIISTEISLDIKTETDNESHPANTDTGPSEQTNGKVKIAGVKIETEEVEMELLDAKEAKMQISNASEVEIQLPNASETKIQVPNASETKIQVPDAKEAEVQLSSDVKPSENDGISSVVEEEPEFRPPTPDPRFQVLEPVCRGTELSALCCIM